VTVVDQRPVAERPDPFAIDPAGTLPDRPRLLSHVGRWGRARRWLPGDARRVLDVGAAFGYGSAALAGGGRRVVGVEYDRGNVEAAKRILPGIVFLQGDAEALPVADDCADAVVMLDIVEHLGDPRRAMAEAHRVLRPGGVVIISVPNRGLLHRFDALNVYSALRRRRPHWPGLEADTESAGHEHRHFTRAEVEQLLRPWFAVDRVARTGLGVQELLYLALLLARVPFGRQRVSRAFLPLHLLLYCVDDLIPAGRLGYHMAVRGVRRDAAP
jgi:SAM-dependent methyltransferase